MVFPEMTEEEDVDEYEIPIKAGVPPPEVVCVDEVRFGMILFDIVLAVVVTMMPTNVVACEPVDTIFVLILAMRFPLTVEVPEAGFTMIPRIV